MLKDYRYEDHWGLVFYKYILLPFFICVTICMVTMDIISAFHIDCIDIGKAEQQTYILDNDSFEKSEILSNDKKENTVSFLIDGKNPKVSIDENTVIDIKNDTPEKITIEKKKHFDLIKGFCCEKTKYEFY